MNIKKKNYVHIQTLFSAERTLRKGLDLLFMSGFLSLYLHLAFPRHHSSSLGCSLHHFVVSIHSVILALYLIQDLSVQCWVIDLPLNSLSVLWYCTFWIEKSTRKYLFKWMCVYRYCKPGKFYIIKKICVHFLCSTFIQLLQ